MAAPAAMQPQESWTNSDNALKVFFACLPPKEFHRCRCLSSKWAAELTSDEMIDKHLSMCGKIQLDYKSVMQYLVLKCCDRCGTGAYTESESEVDSEMAEQTDINSEGDDERSKPKESSGDANQETTEKEEDGEDDDDDDDDDDADDEDEEDIDWREEYRIKGYVAVDKDYYVRRAEMHAWANELWGNIDFSGLTVADSDDELLKAYTIPLGALHHRIRQPVLETEGDIDIAPIHGRQKTDEDVDQEIIAFLVGLRNMDPQPQFFKELNTYQYPWPSHQAQGYDSEEELIGHGEKVVTWE